eukprot:scaffold54950_cov50-Phaeocystis_antarctica.AAC.3
MHLPQQQRHHTWHLVRLHTPSAPFRHDPACGPTLGISMYQGEKNLELEEKQKKSASHVSWHQQPPLNSLSARPEALETPGQTPHPKPTPPSPPDNPQQASSLLVAGEELKPDSIKGHVQIAPTQAAPHSPQSTSTVLLT